MINKVKKLFGLAIVGSLLAIPSHTNAATVIEGIYGMNQQATSNTSTYYHLGLGYHATWQRTDGSWTDGKPGSNQSSTITVDVNSLAERFPEVKGKKITSANVRVYKKSDSEIPEWSAKNFEYWPTVKNEGNKPAFFKNYSDLIANNLTLNKAKTTFNKDTGKLTYTINYNLSTVKKPYGFEIHTYFRDLKKKGIDWQTAATMTDNKIASYTGANALNVTYDVLHYNPATAATFYMMPVIYEFKVESNLPRIEWRIGGPVCAGNTSSLVLEIADAKAGWEKLNGYIIVYDDSTFVLKEYVQIVNGKVKHVLCLPKGKPKLDVCYVPNPNVPEEKWCVKVKDEQEKQDMSLGQTVTLKNHTGSNANELMPGEDMKISFVVKNIVGPLAVGTDDNTNPKATLEITVKDKTTGKVIYTGKNHKTDEVIQPGGMVNISTNDIKIPSNTSTIEACATISYTHDEKGFNIRNNEHDTRCQTFSTTKNYAIRDLTVSPKVVDMTGSSVTQPLVFKFTLANEASGHGIDNPLVTIKQGAKVVWSKNVSVAKGKTTVELAKVMATMSSNTTFTVEVNPNRTEVEKKKDGSEPYADNKKSTSVSLNKLPQCAGCTKSNTSNSWKEKFSLSQTYKFMNSWSHWDDDNDSLCEHPYEDDGVATDSKEEDYTESYTIKKIYLRSKWSVDTKAGDSQGWVDMTNGGNFKIKAGTPLEIKVETNYKTNRNVIPNPERLALPPGAFNIGPVQVTDGVAPVNVPQKTFIQIDNKLKLEDSSSLKNCFELQGNVTGQWYDATAIRTLAPRKNLQGTGNVSAIYIAKDAAEGSYKLDVYTNISKGYQPNNVISGTIKDLQACKSITINVIKNNDIVTSIIQ